MKKMIALIGLVVIITLGPAYGTEVHTIKTSPKVGSNNVTIKVLKAVPRGTITKKTCIGCSVID